MLCRPLHRHEQGQQLISAGGTGVLVLAEWHVLGLGLGGQSRGVCVAMKAKGNSGSRRFSATWNWTRPIRFQAGFSALRKACRSVPDAASDSARAVPRSAHSPSRTIAFRYSAPGITGAVVAGT
jgi:hypothetical protein